VYYWSGKGEGIQRLVREGANRERPVFMFSDEYQEFVTATDAEFYAQSREKLKIL